MGQDISDKKSYLRHIYPPPSHLLNSNGHSKILSWKICVIGSSSSSLSGNALYIVCYIQKISFKVAKVAYQEDVLLYRKVLFLWILTDKASRVCTISTVHTQTQSQIHTTGGSRIRLSYETWLMKIVNRNPSSYEGKGRI